MIASASPNADQTETTLALHQLQPGASARIHSLEGDAASRRRLQEMGLVPGAPIRLIGRAPWRDPSEYDLGAYRLSLRRAQAQLVRVAAMDPLGGMAWAGSSNDPSQAVSSSQQEPAQAAASSRCIALVGNPNAGKSSLFNAMTGLRQRVGNYPGVTVDRHEGRCTLPGGVQARIIDLPGTYSLHAQSPDEAVTTQILQQGLPENQRKMDLLCAVVDAENLGRNLLLLTQVLELGKPVVVALTMGDLASRAGRTVDIAALTEFLGVPVIPINATSGAGVMALGKALATTTAIPHTCPWRAEGVAAGSDADIAARYAWIRGVVERVQSSPNAAHQGRRGIDRLLLHPVLGLMTFFAVMWALFATVFVVADPIMGAFESGGEALTAWLGSALPEGAVHDLWHEGIAPGVGGVLVFLPQIAFLLLMVALLEHSGYLARGSYLLDRPLSAVGLHGRSFVPLLTSHACAIPGIMAARGIEHPRDRLVTMLVAPFMACAARLPVYLLLVGLLFSGYPGWVQGSILFALYAFGIVAAALTALVIRGGILRGGGSGFLIELPSYRTPHWASVVRAAWDGCLHFVKKAGTIILAFSIILWAGLTYPKMDSAQEAAILQQHGISSEQWALASEDLEAADESVHDAAHALQAAAIEHSVVGRFGQAIEPLIAPLGYDWKIGVGLVGAFAAREVFVSTMGIVYGVGAEVEDEPEPLLARMAAEQAPDGSPRYGLLLGISLLVWFAIAMQCISTVAVMVRETKGWRWPMAQLIGMNSLAYVLCLAIWQIGSRL